MKTLDEILATFLSASPEIIYLVAYLDSLKVYKTIWKCLPLYWKHVGNIIYDFGDDSFDNFF